MSRGEIEIEVGFCTAAEVNDLCTDSCGRAGNRVLAALELRRPLFEKCFDTFAGVFAHEVDGLR